MRRLCVAVVITVSIGTVSANEVLPDLTENEMIVLADTMAAYGNVATAHQIYSTIANSTNPDIRTESRFQLGNLAMANGDYATAISYYRQIIDLDPTLARVRLELALAYFMNGEYQAAQFHFEFVRATPDLPATVAEKIDNYLALIRRYKNWTIDLGIGFLTDSNINSVGSMREECINTMFGLLCRPLDNSQSNIGLRINVDTNYYSRITRRVGWKTSIGINVLEFPTSEFDNYSLCLASGPRYIFDDGEISLQPTVRGQMYAGHFYNYGYGLNLQTGWQLWKKWGLMTNSAVGHNKYHRDYIQRALGGYDWTFLIQPRYYLNGRSYIMAGLGFGQNNTKITTYSSNNVIYSIGYFGEFYLGFALLIRLDLANINYKGQRWTVVDQELILKRREDRALQSYLRVSNNNINWHNIIPAISYTYVYHDSNIPVNKFEKHRIEFELIRKF